MQLFDHPTVPHELLANETASWTFLGFTVVSFVATLVWAVNTGRRSSDWLPLIFMAGGALCGFMEPLGDLLGATYYPTNTPLLVFEALDRQIPLFVFVGESMFFATAVYFAYRFFIAGVSSAKMLGIIVVFSLFDAAMEMTSIHFDVMTYYGNNPVLVLGLPLYAIVQNGALAIVLGWLALVLSPHLAGWRALWFIPLIPIGFGAQAFITTWPMYLGLNSDFPRPALLVLGLLVTATNLALPVWCINSKTARTYREKSRLEAGTAQSYTLSPA